MRAVKPEWKMVLQGLLHKENQRRKKQREGERERRRERRIEGGRKEGRNGRDKERE